MRRSGQPSMLGWRAAHRSGGCRPPAASRSRWSLLPAAPPHDGPSAARTVGISRAFVRQRWKAPAPRRGGSVHARSAKPFEMHVAPSNVTDVHSCPSPIGPSCGGVAPVVSAQRSGAANGGGGAQRSPDPKALYFTSLINKEAGGWSRHTRPLRTRASGSAELAPKHVPGNLSANDQRKLPQPRNQRSRPHRSSQLWLDELTTRGALIEPSLPLTMLDAHEKRQCRIHVTSPSQQMPRA